MKKIVNILLDVPLNQSFSYSSEENIVVGSRVLVEFRKNQVVGFVWQNNVDIKSLTFDIKKLKPIIKVFDEVLDNKIIKLVKFIANYYHYPIGQTLFTCIPSLLRKPQTYTLKLEDNKLLKLKAPKVVQKIHLNNEQQSVIAAIKQHLEAFYPAVLYGITGSGKTEVYLELIESVLLKGKQVLVLVPEINLTPQLLSRFKRRFSNVKMQILTSSSSGLSRLKGYYNAQNGEAQIIIGTRLAVFTPFKNLGIIIVDEEHDQSFKQYDGLRYSARDVAVLRASSMKIPVILGSATPSLETIYNIKLKKYELYKLTNRAVETARLPQIKLLDLKTYPPNEGITDIALENIKKCLDNKELSLVFINRRGFCPVITCYECNWISTCNNCSVNMVYHSSTKELKCHHCGISKKIPRTCPNCNNPYLQAIGQGTQKVEEILNQKFPQARISRIDQDTTKGKASWEKLYNKIYNNEVDILVGTQMMAKGHDFHNLTLVVGLNLDSGLYSYDFRSTELLFTQLMQVSGRAGRGDKEGLVLLQTNFPKNELYQYLINHDFAGFANYLMLQRKSLNVPPYSNYVLLRASSSKIKSAMDFLLEVENLANKIKTNDINIFSPVPAIIQKLKKKERAQILIQSNDRNKLHIFLDKLIVEVNNIKNKNMVIWHLDVDPLEL